MICPWVASRTETERGGPAVVGVVPQPGVGKRGREDGGGGDLRAAGLLKLHEAEGAAQDGRLAEAPVSVKRMYYTTIRTTMK